MNKRWKQIIALVKDLSLFIFLKYFHSPKINEEKKIFINFENPNLYHRYFYNLLKTLKIGGYTLYYPMSWHQFRNLRNGDVYLALMFLEKDFLIIQKPVIDKNFIELSDDMFSADYYKTLFQDQNIENNSFHIPMSFHPYMYFNNLWDQTLKNKGPRINSLYTFGNFDKEAYKTIDQYPFGVNSRTNLLEFFIRNENFISVKNKVDLEKLIENKIENKLIFAEKYNYQIPMEKVRDYLSQFRYFLCCPGVFAPLSHNFIEAISAGAIPVIEKKYADTIYPPLENNTNAIIFEDLVDLENIIENQLFNKTKEEMLRLEENIKMYYNAFLHPKSAAENIIKNITKRTIYLNASERSAKLINNE